MKRIAIFCDGTWNSPDIDQPTHVVRLWNATALDGQRSVYVPGVGTGTMGAGLKRIGAGAFGWGLSDNIKRAYRALAMQYQREDEIYLFGFSRGGFTARSLAGMIRKCGIIERPTKERVDQAFDLYRLPGAENHPDALHILKARRALSPEFATSKEDLDFRAVYPVNGAADDSALVDIKFLGVWDTVGSMGVPAPILGPIANLWNQRYRFHDMLLTSMVKSARHAVGLDERRVFFPPSLWDNLDQTRDHLGLNEGDRTPARRYQQIWFIGTHAIIGGSAAPRQLTSYPLDWVAEGARRADLNIEPAPLDVEPGALQKSDALSKPPWLYRVAGALLKWRDGPGHDIELDASVHERLAAYDDYRPRSLRNLMPQLFGDAPIGQRDPPGGGER